jgi:hypothetical protein
VRWGSTMHSLHVHTAPITSFCMNDDSRGNSRGPVRDHATIYQKFALEAIGAAFHADKIPAWAAFPVVVCMNDRIQIPFYQPNTFVRGRFRRQHKRAMARLCWRRPRTRTRLNHCLCSVKQQWYLGHKQSICRGLVRCRVQLIRVPASRTADWVSVIPCGPIWTAVNNAQIFLCLHLHVAG